MRRGAPYGGFGRRAPFVAKPQRRAVTPLRGEVRPQKRFCPLQTCSPHSKPSQPPLGAWRAGRVHPHLFSVWQLGGRVVFPPLQSVLSPPAGRVFGDTVDSPLQRSDLQGFHRYGVRSDRKSVSARFKCALLAQNRHSHP